jgi:microsomal dipeptidase-like Zn-dependent dipeptidase
MKFRGRILMAIVLVMLALAAVFFGIVPGEVARLKNPVILPPPYPVSAAAVDLHRQLFVADLHADSLLWGRDLLAHGSSGHIDVPRLLLGSVGLQTFSVVTQVPAGRNFTRNASDALDIITPLAIAQRWPLRTWGSTLERALYQAAMLHEFAADSNGKLLLVESAGDLQRLLAVRARGQAVVGGLLAIEGAQSLEGELRNLDVLFAAGFRMLGLVHFFDNAVGGSVHGERKGGLTGFGRAVLQRAEQLGMLIDVAHASGALMDDVLALATRPVLSSHGGVRGTCDNHRSLSDAQARAIAASGGVIGIGFWPRATCGDDVAAIVRALRYAVDLVGVEHVALGSDFDGSVQVPFDVSGLPLLTEALLQAGFSPADLEKVMGGNVVRVLQATLPAV